MCVSAVWSWQPPYSCMPGCQVLAEQDPLGVDKSYTGATDSWLCSSAGAKAVPLASRSSSLWPPSFLLAGHFQLHFHVPFFSFLHFALCIFPKSSLTRGHKALSGSVKRRAAFAIISPPLHYLLQSINYLSLLSSPLLLIK